MPNPYMRVFLSMNWKQLVKTAGVGAVVAAVIFLAGCTPNGQTVTGLPDSEQVYAPSPSAVLAATTTPAVSSPTPPI